MKRLIVIVIVLLILAGAGAGVYFLGYLDPLLGIEPKAGAVAAALPPPEPPQPPFDLPPMLIILRQTDKSSHLVSLRVSVITTGRDNAVAVEQRVPRIQDAFQERIRQLTLADFKGAANLRRLQDEMRDRINGVIAPAKIDRIYFQDVQVQ